MTSEIRLSVLDQSPIPSGRTPADTLANSVDLARLTEHLGYTRYWVAEHHGTGGLVGSAPEILIAHIAAVTETIRVGSGGVMLPHYSALKVAEQFSILETLHPGRIDLALGRAPGSDGITSLALQRNRRTPNPDDFADQLAELLAWFGEGFPDGHPFGPVKKTPKTEGSPEIWLLSSSGWSARTAARFGVGIAFAHFFAPEGGPEALAQYRREFIPRSEGDRPKSSAAFGVICADSDDEAEQLALPFRLWRHRQRRLGIHGPVPSVEEASNDPYSDAALAQRGDGSTIVGGPERVRDGIEAAARLYGVDEVIVVTITHDHEARRHSYELVAEAFGLEPTISAAVERV